MPLQGQPFEILLMLLQRPGEVVARTQIHEHLWPEGTFVDFDHSLNTAINKIREVLGDSAENPRFVETLARRGYRLITPVEALNQTVGTESGPQQANSLKTFEVEVTLPDTQKAERREGRRRRTRMTFVAVAPVVGSAVWYYIYRSVSNSSHLPPFKVVRLTSF